MATKQEHIKDVKDIVSLIEFQPPHRERSMLDQLRNYKANALYRTSNFAAEVIWNKRGFVYPRNEKGSSFRKGLFLFRMVRKDAQAYLQVNKIKLPSGVKITNEHNYKYDYSGNNQIAATDINHCYWRIAYNLGIISQHTYEKGLPDEFKEVRLAALSTLGAAKIYQKVIDGVLTQETVKVGGDRKKANIYKLIRYTCYQYMQEAMKMLGADFLSYRTDCIYYRKTKENMSRVQKLLHGYNMQTKQLYKVGRKKIGKLEQEAEAEGLKK